MTPRLFLALVGLSLALGLALSLALWSVPAPAPRRPPTEREIGDTVADLIRAARQDWQQEFT